MNLRAVRHYVEQQLQHLSPTLTYHNAGHTLYDVLPACQRLGAAFGLDTEEQSLLETAALLHDIGYVQQYADNEPIAANRARRVLPDFDYSDQQIGVVERLILVTAMPQAPTCSLEAIMCDADLDSLWRDDFMVTSLTLRAELENQGIPIPHREWWHRQIDFMKHHQYFCSAEASLRRAGKQRNLSLLERMVDGN